MVLFPDGRQVPLTAVVHDDSIRQYPVPVVGNEVVRHHDEPGVILLAADDVVTQGAEAAVRRPHREVAERFETFFAALYAS